jgi:hypothetical protein
MVLPILAPVLLKAIIAASQSQAAHLVASKLVDVSLTAGHTTLKGFISMTRLLSKKLGLEHVPELKQALEKQEQSKKSNLTKDDALLVFFAAQFLKKTLALKLAQGQAPEEGAHEKKRGSIAPNQEDQGVDAGGNDVSDEIAGLTEDQIREIEEQGFTRDEILTIAKSLASYMEKPNAENPFHAQLDAMKEIKDLKTSIDALPENPSESQVEKVVGVLEAKADRAAQALFTMPPAAKNRSPFDIPRPRDSLKPDPYNG